MILGIDIGGTTAKCGIVDEHGHVLSPIAVPTKGRTADELITALIDTARSLLTVPVQAIGIGCAGRIHPPSGTVLRAGNLPFRNEPLAARMQDALGLPVFLGNDANCALLAEVAYGACKDCRDALLLTLGTGIGGAILIDGHIVEGHNFRAGELGHFVLDRHGPPCPCGLNGCFEQYASATALVQLATAAAQEHPHSRLAGDPHSGKAVFAAAAQGCPVANEVLGQYAHHLALGINSLTKIFMPERIVLAGGIAGAGDALLCRLSDKLLPEADVYLSTLGSHAGILGAAFLASSSLDE